VRGTLLFQWRASDHYQLTETFQPINNQGRTHDNAFGFIHINSADKDPQGNYYISSRYMHTVTCIAPTGAVRWILGGGRKNFTDISAGCAMDFSWQHHAVYHPNNTLTLFHNGAPNMHTTAQYSRGISISLDTVNMTATLLGTYVSPDKLLVTSQGFVQILPESGSVFMGWGHTAAYTEFTAAGDVLNHAYFGSPAFSNWCWVKSYRAFKSP
jgi:hypothetical protein